MNQTSSNCQARSVLATLVTAVVRHRGYIDRRTFDPLFSLDGDSVRAPRVRARKAGEPFVLIDPSEILDHLLLPVASLGAPITAAAYVIYTSGSTEQPKGGRILCDGAALACYLAERLLARGAELWDAYGSTEPAVWSTPGRIAAGQGTNESMLLGPSLAHSELHVIDCSACPAPLGGARLCHTKDSACHLPVGWLDFLGRFDHQIKIRGYCIELGKIVSALEPESDAAPAAKKLRHLLILTARLPAFRVPAAFAAPNGKIDHRALPAPQLSTEAADGFAAPILKQVPWEGPLPLSFAQQRLWFLAQLEPQSAACLIAQTVRVTGRLAAPALSWSLGEVARRHQALPTTFAEIAGEPCQVIAASISAAAALPVVDLRGLEPGAVRVRKRLLADVRGVTGCLGREAQRERQLLASSAASDNLGIKLGEIAAALEAERDAVPAPKALRRCQLAVPALTWSLGEVAWHHEELRTTFAEIAGKPWQAIGAAEALFAACCQRQAPVLLELPVQYADYAVWQRRWLTEGALESQLTYGWGRLLELSTDHPRPAVQTFRGATLPVASPASLSVTARPERSLACTPLFQASLDLQDTLRTAGAETVGAFSAASDNLVCFDTSGSTRLPSCGAMIRHRSAADLAARMRRWACLSSEASTKELVKPAEPLAVKELLRSPKGYNSRIAHAWTIKEVEKAKPPNRRLMLSGIDRKYLGIEEVEL